MLHDVTYASGMNQAQVDCLNNSLNAIMGPQFLHDIFQMIFDRIVTDIKDGTDFQSIFPLRDLQQAFTFPV